MNDEVYLGPQAGDHEADKRKWAVERTAFWWQRCCEVFATPHRLAHRPTVDFSTRFKVRAGVAMPGLRHIVLAEKILLAEPPEAFDQTIGHEVAHIYSWEVLGSRGHDEPWRRCMRNLGLEVRRCHSYPSALANRVRRPKATARCNKCERNFSCGPTIAKRIARGQKYKHSVCGSADITIVDLLGVG